MRSQRSFARLDGPTRPGDGRPQPAYERNTGQLVGSVQKRLYHPVISPVSSAEVTSASHSERRPSTWTKHRWQFYRGCSGNIGRYKAIARRALWYLYFLTCFL